MFPIKNDHELEEAKHMVKSMEAKAEDLAAYKLEAEHPLTKVYMAEKIREIGEYVGNLREQIEKYERKKDKS